jgi:SAM-dependent methyltransferase
MTGRRRRWDERYRSGPAPDTVASFVADDLAPRLGTPGKALDVAGGAGRNSLWLAERGWDTTLVDLSPVALELAREAALSRGLQLATLEADLAVEPLPPGPWDLILMVHYLERDLFPQFADSLAPGGILAFSIATVRNLDHHSRPPRPYLLEPGEATTLVGPLEILSAVEGWHDDHRHEARVIARRP